MNILLIILSHVLGNTVTAVNNRSFTKRRRAMIKQERNGRPLAEDCIRAYRTTGEDTDVLGSYTGIYRNGTVTDAPLYSPYSFAASAEDSVPVQDADDL